MRGQIKFKPGLSDEYKDLVNSILKYETNERIPLIKVFDHPWVKNFERKYNLCKTPAPPKGPSKEELKQKELEKKKKEEEKRAAAAAALAAE